jgi:hypothetical protein
MYRFETSCHFLPQRSENSLRDATNRRRVTDHGVGQPTVCRRSRLWTVPRMNHCRKQPQPETRLDRRGELAVQREGILASCYRLGSSHTNVAGLVPSPGMRSPGTRIAQHFLKASGTNWAQQSSCPSSPTPLYTRLSFCAFRAFAMALKACRRDCTGARRFAKPGMALLNRISNLGIQVEREIAIEPRGVAGEGEGCQIGE